GRIVTPVNGRHYIRYAGGDSFGFASAPTGGGGVLVDRYSAAAKLGQSGLRRGAIIETQSPAVQKVFASTRWKIMDTGGGLRRWQMDCYFGEDEPLGPGKFMGRPRATTFEYAYANARIINLCEAVFVSPAFPWGARFISRIQNLTHISLHDQSRDR